MSIAAPPLEKVTLIEEEHVLARGSTEITWRIRKNDGWVRPSAFSGALVQRLDRGAGIVWRTRIDLELPRGTRLLRVEARPDPSSASTLAHLTGGSRGARKKTIRTEYRVGPRGTLEPGGG